MEAIISNDGVVRGVHNLPPSLEQGWTWFIQVNPLQDGPTQIGKIVQPFEDGGDEYKQVFVFANFDEVDLGKTFTFVVRYDPIEGLKGFMFEGNSDITDVNEDDFATWEDLTMNGANNIRLTGTSVWDVALADDFITPF